MAINRAISVTQLYNQKFKKMGFTDKWLDSFGDPELTGTWLIWGSSGNGKTRLALQLVKYLSGFARVAYNSLEEGCSLSMQRAFVETGMNEVGNRVILLDKEPICELIKRLKKRKSPDVIVLDSVQYTGLTYAEYKNLRDMFPKKLFVLVSHADGTQPAGRVAKSIRYDAFVKIEVSGFVANVTSRYGGGAPYIIWDEGMKLFESNNTK